MSRQDVQHKAEQERGEDMTVASFSGCTGSCRGPMRCGGVRAGGRTAFFASQPTAPPADFLDNTSTQTRFYNMCRRLQRLKPGCEATPRLLSLSVEVVWLGQSYARINRTQALQVDCSPI